MPKLYLTLSDGRIFGTLDTERRLLTRKAHSTKHFLQRPPAIALDAVSYDAHRSQFDAIVIYDLDTGREYRIDARSFDAYRFEVDRGYGRQYAVHLSRWTVHDPNAAQQQPQLALL